MAREDVVADGAAAELFVQKVPQRLRNGHDQFGKVRRLVRGKRSVRAEQRPVVDGAGLGKGVEAGMGSMVV